MSETRTVDPVHIRRRAVADILSVCWHARPASAARWLTSFATHMTECQSTRSLVPAERIWVRTGAEFAIFGSGEDLRWMDQVDQVHNFASFQLATEC